MMLLAESFHNTVVGNFAYGLTPMEMIKRFITSLRLKGDCPVGLLDTRHVLLRPVLEDGYTRLLFCLTWFVWNAAMVISKWTLDFRANQESSIVPVWASFPELLLPFFSRSQLVELASALGRFLKMD